MEVVKFVHNEEVELSVRSGGHSYACTSSRVTQHISISHADSKYVKMF